MKVLVTGKMNSIQVQSPKVDIVDVYEGHSNCTNLEAIKKSYLGKQGDACLGSYDW